MKEILKKHMQEDLPVELKRKQKTFGLPILVSSFALLVVLVINFQPKQQVTADQWWQDFDRELDQEMELVLAELDSI